MTHLINIIFNKIYGRKAFQDVFQKLYSFSLRGLNFGIVGLGEKYVMHYIKDKLSDKESLTIFDVGANVGEYSEWLNDIFGNNATIYAFEPALDSYGLLKTRCDNKNIIVNNIGLGSKKDSLKLYRDKAFSSHSSLFQKTTFNKDFPEFVEVKIDTLDEFCRTENINNIDFLKIDVEGFENEVLKGAEKMLHENKIRFIQFEFGPTQIEPRVFFRDFWNLLHEKYKIYKILADGLHEIPVYHDRLEIFIYANYFAELKS